MNTVTTVLRRAGLFTAAAASTVVMAGAPAHADGPPMIGGDGTATIFISQTEAQGFGLYDYFHEHQVCDPLTASINDARQRQGLAPSLTTDGCIDLVGRCVRDKQYNVLVTLFANNSAVCDRYSTNLADLLL
ncbi:MAG: hypothetical protein QM747_02165 [Nocardioides sp.]